MKKLYASPVLIVRSLAADEDILVLSRSSIGINVTFEDSSPDVPEESCKNATYK